MIYEYISLDIPFEQTEYDGMHSTSHDDSVVISRNKDEVQNDGMPSAAIITSIKEQYLSAASGNEGNQTMANLLDDNTRGKGQRDDDEDDIGTHMNAFYYQFYCLD